MDSKKPPKSKSSGNWGPGTVKWLTCPRSTVSYKWNQEISNPNKFWKKAEIFWKVLWENYSNKKYQVELEGTDTSSRKFLDGLGWMGKEKHDQKSWKALTVFHKDIAVWSSMPGWFLPSCSFDKVQGRQTWPSLVPKNFSRLLPHKAVIGTPFQKRV
jgi:hypothetical protein